MDPTAHSQLQSQRIGTIEGHRRLQQYEISGELILQSVAFLAVLMAICFTLWILFKLSLRLVGRLISHVQSAETRPPQPEPSPIRNGDGSDLVLDTFYFRERLRQELQQSNGAYSYVNGFQKYINTHERRAFLEQALLGVKFGRAVQKGNGCTSPNNDPLESACAICLEEYTLDEKVCRSYNRHCRHLFHRDCIIDWLVKDETCPCCRQPFLQFYDDENAENDSFNKDTSEVEQDDGEQVSIGRRYDESSIAGSPAIVSGSAWEEVDIPREADLESGSISPLCRNCSEHPPVNVDPEIVGMPGLEDEDHQEPSLPVALDESIEIPSSPPRGEPEVSHQVDPGSKPERKWFP